VDGSGASTGTSFADGSGGLGGGQFDSKASSNGDEDFGDYRDDNDDADNFAKRAWWNLWLVVFYSNYESYMFLNLFDYQPYVHFRHVMAQLDMAGKDVM